MIAASSNTNGREVDKPTGTEEYAGDDSSTHKAMLREIARANAAEFRTAASELGEGSQAGGGSVADAVGIREWAERSKRLILDPWFERLPLLSNSTSEHEVWYDEPGGTVYKRTWPGYHGQVPEIINGVVSRRNATPQEYLIRQALQNEVFDSSMKLEGVHTANKPSMIIGEPAGLPSFVVSQHFEEADDSREKTPSLQTIASFMKENGFLPAPKSYFGWYRPSDGVVIVDAKPDNFVLQADGPVPIDVQMRQFTPEEMKLAELAIGEERFVPNSEILKIRPLRGHKVLTPKFSHAELAEELFGER